MARILTLLAIFGCVWATAAAACPPTAIDLGFSSCFGRSPVNDVAPASHQYTLEGTLTSAGGGPCVGVSVELRILSPTCVNPGVFPSSISDANGRVVWDATALTQGGGACLGAPVAAEIVFGTTVLATFPDVRSPDVNGDGTIGLADLSAFQQSFVDQSDLYVGDMDCDGNIFLSDLARFQAHF